MCYMYVRIGTSQEKKNFKRRPQNRILIPLRACIQNFHPASLSFLYASLSPTPLQDTPYMAQSCPVLPNRRQAWPSGRVLDL